MALSDDDVEEIYAMINEALEANDIKERARSSRRVSDKNSLEIEYHKKREALKKKAKNKTPRQSG